MAETGSIQARLRDAADRAALDTLVRYTTLRGEQAQRIARRVVTAAAPNIRAQYANQLIGASQRELLTAGLIVVGTAGVDLAALITLFARGGRKSRILAVTATTLHAGVVTYARIRRHRMITAARAEPSARTQQEAVA
jgi:hypothetical protein